VPTLFNLDFKYAGLSADRIKQLNREIEEHSNTKLAMGRKHDRVATQLREAIEGIEEQVGEWEQTVAETEGRMREVLVEEDRRRNRVQLDYYPILKKIFNEVEQTDLKVFRKVAILRKNNIQLNKLADWP
jgi:CRISPR/Cas system CSM-associated protein Csm2 small subunit